MCVGECFCANIYYVCARSCWDRLVSIISKLHKMNFHFISAMACDTSTYFVWWMKQIHRQKWNNIEKVIYTTTCCRRRRKQNTIIHLRWEAIDFWMKLAHNWQLLNSQTCFYQIFRSFFSGSVFFLFIVPIYFNRKKRCLEFSFEKKKMQQKSTHKRIVCELWNKIDVDFDLFDCEIQK